MARKRRKPLHLVSVIIPAYKQEKTIKRDIKQVLGVLEQLRHKYEVIVVVDGQVDKTYLRAKQLKHKKLKVLVYKRNLGKGHAIRYGMVHAKGDIIGFIDAGMDLNPNGLAMLLEHFEWYNADIIVGSKLHPVSKVNYPLYRKVLSIGYRRVVRILFGLKIRDTQVGMKFFKREVIKAVIPRLLVKQYAFDIEILAVAHSLGFKRIFEAPVELIFKDGSSINSKGFWRVIILMLVDTSAVFYRLKVLKYYENRNKKKWMRNFKSQYRIKLSKT